MKFKSRIQKHFVKQMVSFETLNEKIKDVFKTTEQMTINDKSSTFIETSSILKKFIEEKYLNDIWLDEQRFIDDPKEYINGKGWSEALMLGDSFPTNTFYYVKKDLELIKSFMEKRTKEIKPLLQDLHKKFNNLDRTKPDIAIAVLSAEVQRVVDFELSPFKIDELLGDMTYDVEKNKLTISDGFDSKIKPLSKEEVKEASRVILTIIDFGKWILENKMNEYSTPFRIDYKTIRDTLGSEVDSSLAAFADTGAVLNKIDPTDTILEVHLLGLIKGLGVWISRSVR